MTTSSTREPLTLLQSGKVRELYDAGDGRLLMVASDRISAFDVIMAEPIPDKGRVLTAMTAFWLDELSDLAPNHLISADPADFPDGAAALPGGLAALAGRSMLVHRAEMLDIECIVRGYLAGSAYKEYEREGTVHGMAMPAGLRHADRLPEPIFTPSTKATEGHDLNIGMAEAIDLVGQGGGRGGVRALPGRLPAGRRPGRGAGHRHLRHQVRARLHRRRPVHLRRGADPGLVPVLAGRRLRPGDQPARPSTSSPCATGSRPSPGTSSRPRRRCPTPIVAATSAAVRRRLRAGLRPSVVRLVRCLIVASSEHFSVLVEVRLREGIADPQGATIERALPALGLRRRLRHAGGQGVPLRHRRRRRRRRPGPGHGGGRAAAGQPGHRGVDGDRASGRRRRPDGAADRRGRLPGDQLRARRRPGRRSASGASADLVWHGDTYGRRVRRPHPARRVRPRRLPAPGGHRPVLAGHGGGGPLRRRRRAGGRDLQRLPGADRGRPAARRPAEEPRAALPLHHRGRSGSTPPTRCSPGRCPSAPSCRIPINHFEGNYTCDAATLAELRDEDRVVLRYVDNPNGSVDDIAGICNRGRNVVGLMPHPERASDPLLGSVDGSVLLRALLASAGLRPCRRRRCGAGQRLSRRTVPAGAGPDGRLGRPVRFSRGCGGSWPAGAPRR